ncbi:MAG: hypothetical protein Q8L26_01300 [Candidatus Omnitrophota bacterium]|nr:hypothetical protein [Candidatus Omnitrophota bacterium]
MIKNILIFAFLELSLLMPSSFCQDNIESVDEMFIGTWEATVGSVRSVITIKLDGTFISKGYCPLKESPDILTGTWEVKDNEFIWTYNQDTILVGEAGEKDINPIQAVSKEKFVLKEMNGSITTFKRIVENSNE